MKWVSMFAYHLVLDSLSLKSQIHLYCNTQCQSTSCCYLFNDPAYLYTITDKLFTPVLFVFDLLNTVRLYGIQYCFYISYLNRRIVNITLPDIYRVLLAFYLCIENINNLTEESTESQGLQLILVHNPHPTPFVFLKTTSRIILQKHFGQV